VSESEYGVDLSERGLGVGVTGIARRMLVGWGWVELTSSMLRGEGLYRC
jgi:hypothetical protein